MGFLNIPEIIRGNEELVSTSRDLGLEGLVVGSESGKGVSAPGVSFWCFASVPFSGSSGLE